MSGYNKIYNTFTGIDTIAFALFPNCKPILLGSITTISHSIYREKKPVPLIGRINTAGYTRGMRSVAGTLVFTLMNQHFVRDLVEQIPYLKEHEKIKSDELPFFDIMIISANEYGSTCKMMIYGVDLFEEGQVISINDIYIENTFSFVARDIDNFERSTVISNGRGRDNATVNSIKSFSFVESNQSKVAENADIIKLQKDILKLNTVTGVYNNETMEKVKKLQKEKDISPTGLLDSITYDVLFNNKKSLKITSKRNTLVYDKDSNKIIGVANYGENYIYYGDEDDFYIDYHGHKGYVDKKNVSISGKNATNDSISIKKSRVSDIDEELFNIKLQENHKYKISINTVYAKNKITNIVKNIHPVNISETNYSIFKESSESFIYDLEYGYPKIIEVFIFCEDDILEKKVFDLRGVKWQEN